MKKNLLFAVLIILLCIVACSCSKNADDGSMSYIRSKVVYPNDIGTDAIIIPASMFSGDIDDNGAFLWNDENRIISSEFDVHVSGSYFIVLEYMSADMDSETAEISIDIESGSSVTNIGHLNIARPVVYETLVHLENKDDARPGSNRDSVVGGSSFDRLVVRLLTGDEDLPATAVLQAGKAEITLTGHRSGLYIKSVCLVPVTAVAAENTGYAPATEEIKIQAEDIYRASSPVLSAQYDRSDAAVEPADPYTLKLNIAGGSNYRRDGQWIEWTVNIPSDAVYKLSVKARQAEKSGLISNRRLYIDGKITTEECFNVLFPYGTDWYVRTVSDNIPLSAGEHIIRLEVVPGPLADTVKALRQSLLELNGLYRQIIMVTGVNPDPNRDYYIERDIPGLLDDMRLLSVEVDTQRSKLESLSGGGGSELALLSSLVYQLASFADEPGRIPSRLANYKSNLDALGSYILSLSEQPLDIDWILLSPPGIGIESANANIIQNLLFDAQALIGSFLSNDDDGASDAVRVWVNAGSSGGVTVGRDQLTLIQDITDNFFTPKTGIKVKVSLVQQGIGDAILAGSGPDAVIYAPDSEPAPLAMRGALVNLSGMPGYDKLAAELSPSASVPYTYNDGVYGIPLTQVFQMMFYRTDIFGSLGIEPPETWDELRRIIPVIQRKNMQIGVPSGDVTFACMLFQSGSGYYEAGNGATVFKSDLAISLFRDYTRLFSDYGLPLNYDFFNRFRSGEMPLGIADYTMYGQLTAAAPEINGLWAMTTIPGTKTGDNIDGSSVGSGLGCYLINDSNRTGDAWEFIKWFAGSEAQSAFGRGNEALLGTAGRYAPANMETFESLPWLSEEKAVIEEAWQFVKSNPQPPGAYYTGRNLSAAFRHVVINGSNPREMLKKYGEEIDREIARKIKEYGG